MTTQRPRYTSRRQWWHMPRELRAWVGGAPARRLGRWSTLNEYGRPIGPALCETMLAHLGLCEVSNAR